MINGYRRSDLFIAKAYKKQSNSHQCYKIINITENGELELEWQRADEKVA